MQNTGIGRSLLGLERRGRVASSDRSLRRGAGRVGGKSAPEGAANFRAPGLGGRGGRMSSTGRGSASGVGVCVCLGHGADRPRCTPRPSGSRGRVGVHSTYSRGTGLNVNTYLRRLRRRPGAPLPQMPNGATSDLRLQGDPAGRSKRKREKVVTYGADLAERKP